MSPTNKIDPFGLWTMAIHNRLIRGAFPKLSLNGQWRLTDASAMVDSLYPGQLESTAYQHAMSLPGEDPARAAAKWLQFIQIQTDKAKTCGTDHWDALWEFGKGLHALADSTSPAHVGFQPWFWLPTRSEFIAHHRLEEDISPNDYERTITLMRHYYQATFGQKAW